VNRLAEQPWFEVRTGPMVFSLSSRTEGEGWGNYLQIKIPSPRPSPRLGGEREWIPRWPDYSGKLQLVWMVPKRIGPVS
jgi:hypothetical protein